MKPLKILFVGLVFLGSIAAMTRITLAGSIYMQDTPSDTGAEPNPDTGPMWVTEDIWVRNSPDPGFQPYPFTEGSPPWTLPPNQNPVYRDPKKSTPNYVYVQVRNHSTSPSSGTERLRLYWAKASTGLSWPTQWVDYQPGGPLSLLYGSEVTKPRKNGATASTSERNAYVNAILAIGTTPAYMFPLDGDYWHAQNKVHSMGPTNRHETAAFLPWHREFLNRYEVLLQQYDPTVKLLYWDWTTNPSASLAFTGSFSGSIGSPFIPTLAPPSITRGLVGSPPAESNSTILARSPYGPFTSYSCYPPSSGPFMSALEDCSHNYSHGYIGGSSGNMSYLSLAAQDPFFFLLHGNIDRLWAQWQRNPSNLALLDPTMTYSPDTLNANITTTMGPWDGVHGTSLQPWTTAGGYIVSKLPTDPSVVSPPIYDAAPLTIPVLQPGQAVVIQIPWYPPNPADFSSFGPDQGHFCLLARIETSTTAPFGMTFPEGSDVYTNTQNNNHIVWKNLTVVDECTGIICISSILIRNPILKSVQTGLRFADTREIGGSVFGKVRVFADLGPKLFQRWLEGGSVGRGVQVANTDTGRLEILEPNAFIRNITLDPNEVDPVELDFELPVDYPLAQAPPPALDLIQFGTPDNPDAIVGGQRFELDYSKLVLVKSGDDRWRYWDNKKDPGKPWMSLNYDDSKWKVGTAPLGFGDNPATTVDIGPLDHRHITTYFRRTFDVADPSVYRTALLRLMRADGAIVYLNGREIDRVNLPGGANAHALATRDVAGLEREVFFPVKIDPANLSQGKNIIAVEIHLNSPQSDDMRFDLELSANNTETGFPPDVAFSGPPNGALFQAGEIVPVQIEALDSDGRVESVSLYVDGQLVGTAEQAPYTFNWPAGSNGPHRLRAVAVDNNQMQAASFLTVAVVDNVPPVVELLQPMEGAAVKGNKPISASAEASDRNGTVDRVEFWVREADFFMSQSILAATATTPPYTASISGLKPGEYMLWAVAVNDGGGSTQSTPVHISVGKTKDKGKDKGKD